MPVFTHISRLRRFAASPWTAGAVLLLLTLASYASQMARLGFYWDDWTAMWYIHFLGPDSFFAAYAMDRPLLALGNSLSARLVGESALGWQIFAVFARWLSSLALYATLRQLWPREVFPAAAVASLFIVYPGFNQQYIAFTYGNGFLIYAVFLASLASMLFALRNRQFFWFFYPASILLAGYALFTTEYFFGVELLRPLLIWIVLRDAAEISAAPAKQVDTSTTTQKKASNRLRNQTLTSILRLWLPYALVVAAFLGWRLSTATPRAEITITGRLASSPWGTLLELGRVAAEDIYQATLLAWGQTIKPELLAQLEPALLARYALITAGAFLLATSFLGLAYGRQPTRQPHPGEQGAFTRSAMAPGISDETRRCGWQAVGLGGVGLLTGGIPIWMTNLRLELFFPWDRFTIPLMIGALLLLVGLVMLVSRARWQGAVLVGVLVGLSAGMHFQSALVYRKEWLAVRDFFWQLTWRAPAIQPGTIVLTTALPFQYNWDNSLTAPLNWTYAPQLADRQLPYLMYNVESRLSSGLPALESGEKIEEIHRITPFSGSLDQAILVLYNPPACLRLVDPLRDMRLPEKPVYFREALPFSRPELVLPQVQSPASPPLPILGPEVEHGWCYYYQKAELARQRGDWDEIVRLGEQTLPGKPGAVKKTFYRANVSELAPFIEGYARSGQWERAAQLTEQAYQTWENARLFLCDVWESFEAAAIDEPALSITRQTQNMLQCDSRVIIGRDTFQP